ncbi:MAG: bifunctional glycosyltransferase family 2/GtrA family protein [Bacilli bacterium]|nr:bifunctional glycosyltransferase family 2/GtrA family protein [Bacilli bacterium]
MEYIALIPSYQPDDLLVKTVLRCMQSFHIVVVNDGSGPEYDSVFNMIPKACTVLRHNTNRGKGAALKTGLKYIQEAFKDKEYAVVTIDGDGQHTYEDALKVIQKAEKQPDCLILGSRNFKQTDQKKSVFGNFVARTLMRLSTGNNIYDTQTGLRAFTYKNIENLLEIEGNRYEYETNMILYLSRERIPIIEVPIATIYLDNNSRSHYNPLRDSLRIFKQFMKFAMSSIIGFLVDFGLFALLCAIFPDDMALKTIVANIIARIVASVVNFTINMFFVFKLKRGKTLKYAIKYFILAGVNMGLNTAFVALLVDVAGWNNMVAKLLVEAILFVASYIVQKIIVIRAKRKVE